MKINTDQCGALSSKLSTYTSSSIFHQGKDTKLATSGLVSFAGGGGPLGQHVWSSDKRMLHQSAPAHCIAAQFRGNVSPFRLGQAQGLVAGHDEEIIGKFPQWMNAVASNHAGVGRKAKLSPSLNSEFIAWTVCICSCTGTACQVSLGLGSTCCWTHSLPKAARILHYHYLRLGLGTSNLSSNKRIIRTY